MAADLLQGEDCRCALSPGFNEPDYITYSIKKFMIRYVRPRLDTPSSEGRCGNSQRDNDVAGYGAAVRGLRTVEVSIEEATLDWTASQNIFTVPLTIKENDYIWVRIYPNADDLSGFHEAMIQVEEVDHDGEVGGLQPVTFKGTSDGRFTLLGE